MRIFDRLWDETCVVGMQYTKTRLPDGSICYNHPILNYCCALCHCSYMHWLCSDQVWQSLPSVLHDKTICKDCFMTLRAYLALEKKSRKRFNKR